MRVPENLPFVGTTGEVDSVHSLDYWTSIFSGVWGPVELSEIGDGQLSGSLNSRQVCELTFNKITFGNQLFKCVRGNENSRNEPFYSLTFPQSGSANCFVGDTRMQLVPQHAYLINVNSSAQLSVERHYSTFNIQIPVSRLEHRLGNCADILPRGIVDSDPIFHLLKHLIEQLTQDGKRLDTSTAGFLTNKMLDAVAFFLTAGNYESQETIAVHSVRARVLAHLDANFQDPTLTPASIANACGISRSYLYKVFSEGLPIMQLLKRRRLEAAREMLKRRNEKLKLTSVAMACGFSSSSEFSRLFKLAFKIKPSEI